MGTRKKKKLDREDFTAMGVFAALFGGGLVVGLFGWLGGAFTLATVIGVVIGFGIGDM